jgi:hypothetical protein
MKSAALCVSIEHVGSRQVAIIVVGGDYIPTYEKGDQEKHFAMADVSFFCACAIESA